MDELVPGDIILMRAGNLVPADARLLEATDAYLSESVLTGESFPVEKKSGNVPPETPLADLCRLGVSVKLITGDSKQVAQHIAGSA